jgi:hypothetical protein
MDAPFDRAQARRPRALSDSDRRRRLQPALFGLGLQHLGHEFWLALGQCHPRPKPGRQDGQLRARHRRGRSQSLPPRARRRHYLGDRLGLFRLSQPGRHLLSRYLRQGGRSRPGEDGRAQIEPGGQAGTRGRAAGGQGDARNLRHSRGGARGGLHFAGIAFGLHDAHRTHALHCRDAAPCRRASNCAWDTPGKSWRW